ncbi:hypothetical protein MIMGU_mgv11b022211mg, partial [Erythranthe guttata]
RDIVYTGHTLKTSSLAMSRMLMKNNACVCVCFLALLCVYVLYVFLNRNKHGSQRDRHKERANARTTGKGKGKDDGFTPEQRREREVCLRRKNHHDPSHPGKVGEGRRKTAEGPPDRDSWTLRERAEEYYKKEHISTKQRQDKIIHSLNKIFNIEDSLQES